ncbi:TOX high mobility group box family member 3-like isoform X1 [Conger conger]|uniref:TOX high mobility group box family member 3-like isoform X1 n=1 Tax=Conger conger TaxID=82655 RepID=UPI002A5A5343|nr:TOX high mobility group box family member 3-like isoform X1 [Conger conger]
MNLDSSLNAVLTEDSMTVVSPGDVTPISLTGYDLDPISSLQPADSGSNPDIVTAGGLSSEDAEEGSSAPAAFINGVPVTVSVQNVDGQQRIVCVATDGSGGSVSYVGQLTTEASLDFQTEVPPQPLLADDEVPPLPPGAELLSVHPQPTPLQHLEPLEPLEPLHPCLLLEAEPEPRDQDTEEPKKRKGGWPKGKKRKPQREFSAPRAPTTGYVIFVNERKVQLKSENPVLPFTEITKMLGVQWSQLSMEEKQKYNNEAETDKQRYIRELIAYQNTEAYRDFLRRKALNKVKDLCSTEGMLCDEAELENEVFTLSQMDGDENSDLYCRTCNQYFSSLHNKKEHLLGKQHLLTLTEEFEKESGSQRKAPEPEEDPDEDEEEEDDEDRELARLCSLTSLDLSSLEELLLRQVNLREFELQELRHNLDRERTRQERLNSELQQLQKRKMSLEAELQDLRESGPTLESQLHCLKMVPLLFQFHIQIIDTGEVKMVEERTG